MLMLLLSFALTRANASIVYNSNSDQAAFDSAASGGQFYLPAEGPFVPRNFERAEQAAVRIGDYGSACTAVVLSKDGYVATAAHCMQTCLLPQWDGSGPPIHSKKVYKEGLYDVDYFVERKFKPFTCPEYINHGLTIDNYQMQDPEVVWVGRGLMDYTSLLKIPDADFQIIKDMGEDIVILKYKMTDPSLKVTCLPVAKIKPAPGTAAFALGFPSSGDNMNFVGYKQALSFGRVRADIKDDPFVQYSLTKEFSADKAKVYGDRMTALWDHPYQLLTSVKIAGGNSGGAMLNEEGELAGIVFVGIGVDKAFKGQTSISVSMPELVEQVKGDLGEEKSGEIFNCQPSQQAQNQ